jgi:hypothetical protein
MGWRIRRSVKLGPLRLTASKSGLGVSVGVKGARVGISGDGRVRETLSVPGTGISYVEEHRAGRRRHVEQQPAQRVSPGYFLLGFAALVAVIALGVCALGLVTR